MRSFRFGSVLGRAVPAALLLTILAASGCGKDKTTAPNPSGGGGGGRSSTITIVMNASNQGTMAFSPDPDTVKANAVTTWHNSDGITHTVTSDAGSTDVYDMAIPGGNNGAHTYTAAGSYTYHCKVAGHNMHGTVVVEP